MEPGVYPDIPNDEYQASAGVSVSRLKLFAEEGGPAKVKYGQRKETKALQMGTLFHAAILEPHLFEKRYAPTKLDRVGTKAWEAEEQRACGRELVKQDEYDAAMRARDSVMQHRIARELLAPGLLVEQACYWLDEPTGLLCRGKTDGLRPDWRVMIDLKSIADASTDNIAYAVREHQYYWQEAMYRDGYPLAARWNDPVEAFFFIYVEKDPPYLARVAEIPEQDVQLGRDEIRPMLSQWAECERTGVWPGYPEEILMVTQPAWWRGQKARNERFQNAA